MDLEQFEMGFWHPFGPHSDESAEQILHRKSEEIKANGWTLWSFQYRPMLDDWHREIKWTKPNPEGVWAFCSAGGGRDPHESGNGAEIIDCRSYRLMGETVWKPFPEKIKVTHTFRPGQKQIVSVFVVEQIIYPVETNKLLNVEWFKKDGWCKDGIVSGGLPTRGVYLIKKGGTVPLRPFKAVLKLKAPYLAKARTE